MADFRLTPTARHRLKIIGQSTQKTWGLEQRNKYLAELDRAFHTLAARPDRGRARSELAEGLHSFHINRHVIFYIIASDHIAIVDILHDRMEPRLHIQAKTSPT